MTKRVKYLKYLVLLACIAGCSAFEDSATSLAYDIEKSVSRLGAAEGSTYVVVHDAKARAPASVRTIAVQFDKVGALIVWYKDAQSKVIESGSTSYHARFVDTPNTIIVEKSIDSPLHVEIQRRSGRAIVTNVF
jgi:hypothetical protein